MSFEISGTVKPYLQCNFEQVGFQDRSEAFTFIKDDIEGLPLRTLCHELVSSIERSIYERDDVVVRGWV